MEKLIEFGQLDRHKFHTETQSLYMGSGESRDLVDAQMPGIKADFVNPQKPHHVCGLCNLVIRSLMQVDSVHTFCNGCLQEAMRVEKGFFSVN